MIEKRRVVVTGLGAITPIGLSFSEFWDNALVGKSGIKLIEGFDTTEYSSKIAGEITTFSPEDFFDKKIARRMSRFIQFAYAASLEAKNDSGLDFTKTDVNRVGVLLGSGTGGITEIVKEYTKMVEKGPRRVSPFFVPMVTLDMASGQVSIHFGVKGPNYGISSACATSNNAIGLAYHSIAYGESDVMFAGGSEAALSPLGIASFSASKALSCRNDDPATASRPFDIGRDGFVVSEGGATIVLEELGHARKRNAKIYAEITGYAATGDGYHITAPHPEAEGAIRATKLALQEANLQPDQIDLINAHGTSTGLGDIAETKVILSVFGDKVPVTATKSLVGHLLGGSGAIGAAATVKSISCGLIHPTINVANQDPECGINLITEKTELKIEHALCNAFGFGGHNTALIFSKYKD